MLLLDGTEESLEALDAPPAVALVLLASGFLWIPIVRAVVGRFAPPDAALPRPPWTALEGTLVFGAGALFLIGSAQLFLAAGVLGGLLHMVCAQVLMGGLALALARRSGAPGLPALGLGRGGAPAAALLGAGAYCLFAPALWGVLFVWPFLAPYLGIELEVQQVLADVLALEGADMVIAAVLAVLVVPFLEELVFRGFLQGLLAPSIGSPAAIVLCSVAFAGLHGWSAFGPIFCLSLFLGWLQLRTGRLAAPWIAHGLHNAVTLAWVLALS